MGGFVALCRGVTVLYGWMYCMHVWAEDETQSLMIKTCLSHTLQQHNTDKMKAAKKKKEEKIPVFLLRRAPQRGCSTYSCGTRHHFSPLWKKKRRRKKKKSVPRMNRTKHFVFSSFFLAVCPSVKINGGSTIKRKHCSATHAPWLVEMWHH